MKKSIIILSVFMLVVGNLHSQNSEYETDKIAIINFLTKHCSFHDANPTYQEEADEINSFVRKIFEKQYTSDDIPNLITQALQLFYDNSIGLFEDTQDNVRTTIRRGMCYMALAFLSDEYRYPSFLTDARQTLDGITFGNDKMLLIVSMVELYRELTWFASKKRIEYKISIYQSELESREENIGDKNFILEYNKILTDVATSTQNIEK
jgi:hypothetical protein